MIKAVPSRTTTLTIPLMVRQPYSAVIKSYRRERFPLSSLRLLSPTRETEGVVKTIEEDREERWSLPLMGKSGANERNESSLSNCRVQLALSKKEGREEQGGMLY